MRFSSAVLAIALGGSPLAAQAAVDCASVPLQPARVQRATLLAPVSSELPAPLPAVLGMGSGVLGQAFEDAQSIDQVLLRLRIEGCRNVANALPPRSLANPDDPAGFKPASQYDNRPWRFNMTQDGKRMTADEFDAWMKAKGIRVVGQKAPAAPPATPAPAAPAKPD